MVNDNENDDWPDLSGRSVFGDDAPNSQELPVVNMDSESSVFGDEPGSEGASAFGDSEAGEQLSWEGGDDDANSVFGDQGGSSVFGDSDDGDSVFASGSSSLDDDPWADVDASAAAAGFDSDDVGSGEVIIEREIAAPDMVDAPDMPDTPDMPDVADAPDLTGVAAGAGAAGAVAATSVSGGDISIESDDIDLGAEAPAAVTIDSWSTPDQAPAPEAVALDVEPSGDDLDAWSDLSGPAWGEESEAAVEPEAWDPEFDNNDPAVVTIGSGDAGDQFFGYDDPGQGEFDEGFVADEPVGANMQARIITGVALLVVGFIGLALGPTIALALIVLIVALCAGEFYNALRVAGYQPATLLGLAASIAMPIAVFVVGTQAVAMILALSVIFGLLWFLLGVGSEIPVMNIGVTLLGIVYVGVLGSFGAAMLEVADRVGQNGDDGTGLLLAAIIITVGYDVGAFFAGRSIGRTPLTAVSPNKTVEGLIGGAVTSAVAAIVVFGLVQFGEPWGTADISFLSVVALGVLGAIVAPLGDLGESLIKRDLGIKDMGSVLPGHGGFLDRFDALLFVLPAVYFFAEIVFY